MIKRLKYLKNQKGEGYVDVAITVMLVAFLLLFIVNIISLAALNQNLKMIADQLTEFAAQHGTTDIDEYAEELSERTGIAFQYSFNGSTLFDDDGKIQLGDPIHCTVTYSLNIFGFGKQHPVVIRAGSSGLSRVYWK